MYVSMGLSMANVQLMGDSEVEKIPSGDGVTAINAQYDVDENGKVITQRCPCERRTRVDDKDRSICIFDSIDTKNYEPILKEYRVPYIYLPMMPPNDILQFASKRCLFMINITSEIELGIYPGIIGVGGGAACPGICKPFPLVSIAKEWLNNPIHPNKAITCSATIDTIIPHLNHDFSKHNIQPHTDKDNLALILGIARRRIEECRERNDWFKVSMANLLLNTTTTTTTTTNSDSNIKFTNHSGSQVMGTAHMYYANYIPSFFEFTETIFVKRKIRGLFVWMGSISKRYITDRQVYTLMNATFDGINADVGWISSEDQHPCRLGTTVCEEVNQYLAYHTGMPVTRMNYAPASWSCGQRRPIRSLAHVLTLFEPEFVFLGDDDTWINYQLRTTKFLKFVTQNIQDIVFGQLTMGKKVTIHGFFQGGAGYLFGKKTVKELNSFVIQAPPDKARSNHKGGYLHEYQIQQLSIARDVVDISNKTNCPDCAYYAGPNLETSLGVRLIDVCNSLMTSERTCYHSDHSMSRCLVHGAYSAPINADCWGGFAINDDQAHGSKIKMCMIVAVCDRTEHLTCHRYYPNKYDHTMPEMIYHDKPDYYYNKAEWWVKPPNTSST